MKLCSPNPKPSLPPGSPLLLTRKLRNRSLSSEPSLWFSFVMECLSNVTKVRFY